MTGLNAYDASHQPKILSPAGSTVAQERVRSEGRVLNFCLLIDELVPTDD